jgi:hypothetical protein
MLTLQFGVHTTTLCTCCFHFAHLREILLFLRQRQLLYLHSDGVTVLGLPHHHHHHVTH